MRGVALLGLVALMGCGPGGSDTKSSDTDTDGGTDTETTNDTETADTDGGGASGVWTLRTHPCFGNRTDAFLIDRSTWWVGCGTTTSGTGLFRSTDEGRTWAQPDTEPADYFDDFRVNDLWMQGDLLFAAGDNNGSTSRSSDAVVSLDPSDPTPEVATEFANSNQVWNSFPVGSYRATAAGFGIAESLNGTGLVFRTEATGVWADGSAWMTPSRQILDLEVMDNRFYGCGSTIAAPPQVMLPPSGSGAPASAVAFTAVELSQDYTGEMWDVHVDADGILVGGVDQDADVGMVYVSGTDPYDADAWTEISLTRWFPGKRTWVQGVCRLGLTLGIVGRVSNTDNAVAVVSLDGGATWSDITPEAEALHACHVLDDGRLAVAGKDGTVGFWTP